MHAAAVLTQLRVCAVTIDHATKSVSTYGRSGGFGPPDIDDVELVLRSTLPSDYSIQVSVTDYIRG